MSSEGGNDSRAVAKVALIAAAAGAAALAALAYYRTSKNPAEKIKNKKLTLDDLKKWKEEGNVHFTQHRYDEAIDMFTKVIENCEKEKDKDLLAVCHQNRAAARQSRGDDVQAIVDDCGNAVIYKPTYGKAYFRRAQLLRKSDPKQSLSDTLAAMHIDESFAEKLASGMGELMESLERNNTEMLKNRKEQVTEVKPVPITHDQMYQWLYKLVEDEYLRKKYFASLGKIPETDLDLAFQSISDRNFEEALRIVDKNENDPSCLLLSARLYNYKGLMKEYQKKLECFDNIMSTSEPENKQDLLIAAELLRLQTARSLESVFEIFTKAVAEYGPLADFFSSAAFRCTFFDSWTEAHSILTDERLVHSKLSQILAYFVEINTTILNTDTPMNAIKTIAKMEEFVDGFVDDDPHKNWAALALSKVYITFNNTNNAEVLLKELMRRDSTWSVFPIALGHVYTQKGDYKKAMEMCETTLKQEPNNPEAILLKGSLTLHANGNKLENSGSYVGILKDAQPLLERCISEVDFPFINEVLRHLSFTEAKINACSAVGLNE